MPAADWQSCAGVCEVEFHSNGMTRNGVSGDLMFMGIDLDVAPGWALGVSAGHCLTRSGEPWLMKSVIGYRF